MGRRERDEDEGEEWTGGVTGADAEAGAVVWVRRRNGSWWPGLILDPDDLLEGCVVPARPYGTPIKLLGGPSGFIDWYNLKKSTCVKAFRCGEYAECIDNAKFVASHQKRTSNKETKYVRLEDAIMHAIQIEKSRVLDENEINDIVSAPQNSHAEKSYITSSLNKRSSHSDGTARDLNEMNDIVSAPQNSHADKSYITSSLNKRSSHTDGTPRDLNEMNDIVSAQNSHADKSYITSSLNKRSSHTDGTARDLNDIVSAPQNSHAEKSSITSSRNKRSSHTDGTARDLNDIKENSVQDSSQTLSLFKQSRLEHMRALREMGSKKVPKQKSSAGIFTDGHQAVPLVQSGPNLDYDLCVTNGIEKSKPTDSSTKRKPSDIVQPDKNSRKKDRCRHLSKLCNDSAVAVKSDFLVNVNNCSYSSDTSSVDTLVGPSHSNHDSAAESVAVNVAEVSCMTGFLNDNHSDGDAFFRAPYPIEVEILDEGHFHMHGSFVSVKDQISKPKKQNVGYKKACIPSVRGHRSSKKKSMRRKVHPSIHGHRSSKKKSMRHKVHPSIHGHRSSKKKSISHKVHHVDLVSLMNELNGPFVTSHVPVEVLGGVVGYPVPVEVLDDSHPATSSLNLTE